MTTIHPTSIVEDGASIGEGVTIGPYCVIGPEVVLKDGVTLEPHIVITGMTELGRNCHVYPFTSLGYKPQDLKYRGEKSRLVIGDNTTIREHVTMNPGTEGGGMLTSIGTNCLIMGGVHIAHDCHLGNNVIMVNNSGCAGHVTIGDNAIFSGSSGAHQYTRIGEGAFIGGMTGVENDVIPFGLVIGNRGHLAGLNIVGLKRAGVGHEQIHALRKAYKMLFDKSGTFAERVDNVADQFADVALVMKIVDFIRTDSDRRLVLPAGDPD